MRLDDQQLLRSIARGDEAAFAELYARYSASLFRFALHMSGNSATAEEAMQETFLTIIREPGAYDPKRGAVAAFLFGIVRVHVRRATEKERAFVPSDELESRSTHDSEAAPARDDELAQVRRAVGSLPARYREVVVLCDLEELSYERAAAILQCPVGTVRSRLHRARALLMQRMRPGKSDRRSARCLA